MECTQCTRYLSVSAASKVSLAPRCQKCMLFTFTVRPPTRYSPWYVPINPILTQLSSSSCICTPMTLIICRCYSRADDVTITVVLAHSQVLDRRWISHCKAQRSFGWPFDQQIVRSTPVLSSWQCNENDTNNTIRDREADTILL